MSADPKRLVRRLVDDVMNNNHPDALDKLCTPALAPKLRLAFSQFRDAFPDWHQDIRELFAERAPPSSPASTAPEHTSATGAASHPPERR